LELSFKGGKTEFSGAENHALTVLELSFKEAEGVL
jgi:hypothetical protein